MIPWSYRNCTRPRWAGAWRLAPVRFAPSIKPTAFTTRSGQPSTLPRTATTPCAATSSATLEWNARSQSRRSSRLICEDATAISTGGASSFGGLRGWAQEIRPAACRFECGASSVASVNSRKEVAGFQRACTIRLSEGLSERDAKSQRWSPPSCAAPRSAHVPSGSSVFALRSSASVPRMPSSSSLARRSTSETEASLHERSSAAGRSREDVPPTWPETRIVPTCCSGTAARQGVASRSMRQRPGLSVSTLPLTSAKANGSFSSPCLKLTLPPSISILRKRRGEDGSDGPTATGGAAFSPGRGSHSATFHSPAESRTRFRLGCERESVPSSMRPRRRLSQRRRTEIESARRKYSWPKRWSSSTLIEFAMSEGPSQKLKS